MIVEQLTNTITSNAIRSLKNLPHHLLIEHVISNKEATFGENGQLCVLTGKHTGRCAKDKYIVDHHDGTVSFGQAGVPMCDHTFSFLKKLMCDHTLTQKVYIQDFIAGGLKCRLLTTNASHALFVTYMFKRAEEHHDKADLTIIHNVRGLIEKRDDMNSTTFVACDLKNALFLIGGTNYAGEVKKSVFTYLSYIMTEKNVLPMHSSVTTNKDGTNSAVFFGLSGTGKTTLSADPDRMLLGDDEHGWGDEGVFNFESGCYAKIINLSREREPMIWGACQSYATLLENVDFDQNRKIDFSSARIAENTRAAYPLWKIKNSLPLGSIVPHPKNIIMLTCDAYGVLPAVSKLSPKAAAYHFLSGYTAKVAGTELGVSEPTATFSACFGAPFMPRKVNTYAEMLVERLERYKPNVWLVNTGWSGGGVGVGNRFPISITRAVISSIVDGSMTAYKLVKNNQFNLMVPKNPIHSDPSKFWTNNADYDNAAQELVKKFNKNFEKFNVSSDIIEAGMPNNAK